MQSRRNFLKSASAAAILLRSSESSLLAAKPREWTRHNVTTPEGQEALATFRIGIHKMMELPPDDARNWFRHAFIHLMDCPHGNWWFYVWHRGYLALLEQTIRELSGDRTFGIPFWDWTTTPKVPALMFGDGLTPDSVSFKPYNDNLKTFTSYLQPALRRYWDSLNPNQRAQLGTRGYGTFDLLWNDVTGFDPSKGTVDPGNSAFAMNSRARYLTAKNASFDKRTSFDVRALTVEYGLSAPDFISDKPELL